LVVVSWSSSLSPSFAVLLLPEWDTPNIETNEKTDRHTKAHTPQHNTTQHNTTQYNATQHDTTQQDTAQHNTTKHGTIQRGTCIHAYCSLSHYLSLSPSLSPVPMLTLATQTAPTPKYPDRIRDEIYNSLR
jgi:hypothetical protein